MRCLRERKLFTFSFFCSFICLVESLVGALKSCLLNALCFRIWNWLAVIFSNALWFDKIIYWAEYEQEIVGKVAHIIYQCELDVWNAKSVSKKSVYPILIVKFVLPTQITCIHNTHNCVAKMHLMFPFQIQHVVQFNDLMLCAFANFLRIFMIDV